MMLSRQKVVINILSVLMILSCYQVYLFRVAGSYIPLSAIVMAMCLPFIKVTNLRDPLFSFFLLSLFLNLISFFWSPAIGLWQYHIVFGYIFIVTYAVFKEIKNSEGALKLIKIFLLSSSLNAFMIILFRFRPDIESAFIINFLELFKNPDRLVFDNAFNVTSIDKAGGVFDNANTAASLHLVCVGLIIMIKRVVSRFMFLCLLIMNVFAVFFSGSKSAVLIMLGSFIFTFALSFLKPGKKNLGLRWLIFLLFTFLFMVLTYYIDSIITSSAFGKDVAKTTDDRLNLIAFASDMFWSSPLLGLGYGGWGNKIGVLASQYGISPSWPPHNSIIDAWSTSGIFNSIICIFLIFIIINRGVRYIIKSNTLGSSGQLVAVLGAVIMPLGDPQPFMGAPQLAAPLGIACCYVYRELKKFSN
ncbi:O-antigen ligase family protein [Serratia sp. DD3]|uniref:O-antigen ligase family protein n=1 Tax=Serratia sp. DD3 TaxID=1410619 RepID=UPI0004D90006|nr:O-antigen ligase family protein [Serratia sp. DD3]KEY57827.1 lipid A core - O-antigen ligase [Serratia sp. DD3]